MKLHETREKVEPKVRSMMEGELEIDPETVEVYELACAKSARIFDASV